MSATIIDLTARLQQRPSLVDQARARIASALIRMGYPGTLICQAKARAERHVSAGIPIDEAVRRVLAWADKQFPPTWPPAA